MMINGGRILKKKELRQTAEWQNKKTDIRKLERKFRNILILTLVVVAAMSAMGHYLMKRYTTTIMNVYATQQDNYVQLVLDQINLQENGTEESIISDIIETLLDPVKRGEYPFCQKCYRDRQISGDFTG